MAMEIEISFGWSSSSRYQDAILYAQKLKSYRSEGAAKEIRHSVREAATLDAWPFLRDLIGCVSGWKSAEIKIDGLRRPTYFLAEEMDNVVGCQRERAASGKGDHHCLGQNSPTDDPQFFGCRFARGVLLRGRSQYDANNSPEWWKFGQLSPNQKSFLIDREEIAKALEKASLNAPCAQCKEFSLMRMNAVVALLPIALEIGVMWKLRYSDINPSHAIGVEPVYPKLGGPIQINIPL